MKKSRNINHLRNRRGLGSVVGAVFMIIVIGAGINVMIWALQQQNKVTETLIGKSNTNLSNTNEDLRVADIKVVNNKLNLTLASEGATAANLTALYIVNETSSQQWRYDLNKPIDGRNPVTNIGQSNPSVVIKSDKQYTIKVVSAAGNTVTARIKPVTNVALPMQLFVLPSTVTTLENVTLLFTVANNLTGDDVMTAAVTPTLSKSLSCTPYPSSSCQFSSDYISPTASTIPKGGSILFKWVFKVTAPAGTTMTFNASLANAKAGNYVIEKGRVEIVQEALTSSETIIGNTLLQKPEVYIIAPGPFGDAGGGQYGYFGVVIANPVNVDMKVKMVAINLYTSHTASNHKIIAGNCPNTGINPPGSTWDCPHDGILRWQNLNNPITVKGYSAYTFLVKTEPGQLSAGTPEPAFMISVSVFTDFGQFSRQGYASNMYDSTPSPIVNVYLTDTSVAATAVQDSPTNHILGNKTLTAGSTAQRLYVAIADFETTTNNAASKILSGAELIINVPKGFINVNIPGVNGYAGSLPAGFSSATKTLYSDGTTQIRATTNEDIGDLGGKEAKVFYFDVDVPSASETRTYAMHSFVAGKANVGGGFPADGFGTFALVVNPS